MTLSRSELRRRAEQGVLLMAAGGVTTEEAIGIFSAALERLRAETIEECARVVDGLRNHAHTKGSTCELDHAILAIRRLASGEGEKP